ncbi:hypothetical protein QBC32DRAFT_78343 [Pseudoneurospora amorphoporcata]|uniref:Uncharacterized protein n=1 Tax=Pseudoneurospora amorphoporcata TaxID=241081 RepID=A0AAN6NKU2_9PEZI|nr:hypothetical protein QBC32DRAFT_78343 [Pseudoneurospora amorphoporcata]
MEREETAQSELNTEKVAVSVAPVTVPSSVLGMAGLTRPSSLVRVNYAVCTRCGRCDCPVKQGGRFHFLPLVCTLPLFCTWSLRFPISSPPIFDHLARLYNDSNNSLQYNSFLLPPPPPSRLLRDPYGPCSTRPSYVTSHRAQRRFPFTMPCSLPQVQPYLQVPYLCWTGQASKLQSRAQITHPASTIPVIDRLSVFFPFWWQPQLLQPHA